MSNSLKSCFMVIHLSSHPFKFKTSTMDQDSASQKDTLVEAFNSACRLLELFSTSWSQSQPSDIWHSILVSGLGGTEPWLSSSPVLSVFFSLLLTTSFKCNFLFATGLLSGTNWAVLRGGSADDPLVAVFSGCWCQMMNM